MIRLTPSKDPNVILKFLKGDAVLKKCSGGLPVKREDLPSLITKTKGIFLIAHEDTKGLGFIFLNPEQNGAYSIHICVRTIGEKTKKIFGLGIAYAQYVLFASEVDAVFPKSYRACALLANSFGFKEDKSIKMFYKTPTDIPYFYQSLHLN